MTETASIPHERATYVRANSRDDGCCYWFPMRVSYGRSMEVAKALQAAGVRYFNPCNEKVVTHKHTDKDGNVSETVEVTDVPVVTNLVFVYGTRSELRELKGRPGPLSYMRFMTYLERGGSHSDLTYSETLAARRITVIPVADMESFIEVTEREKGHVTLIPYEEAFRHYGKRIRFTEGPLRGKEAIIRRISKNNKNKKVHFEIDGLLVAELDYVPRRMYELLEE